MGHFLKISWLATILLSAACLHAGDSDTTDQGAAGPEPKLDPAAAPASNQYLLPLELIPDPTNLFGQLDQMSQLIQLSPEQLKQLRLTIEFLEKLSEDERDKMRIRLAEIAEVSKLRKSEVRHLVPYLPPRFHSDLSQLWMAASDEERASIMKAIEPLENWDKGQYLIARVEEYVAKRDQVYSELIQSLE